MIDSQLELQFVEYNLESFMNSFLRLVELGKTRIRLKPFNEFALRFTEEIFKYHKEAKIYVDSNDCVLPLPQGAFLLTDDTSIDGTMLFIPEAKSLSSILMEYIDLQNGTIIAPITEYYYKNKPLFLISIPKSGTHLLYKLVETFGYNQGIVCPDNPPPGCWYCVEYSNSHTSARSFFIDTVRRSSFGNRHHPFPRSPAIFIYRNPLDILVSEANYYHKDGNTIFHSYLSAHPFEKRLLKLIDDPWLLGSIRDRVADFVAWLDFQNVMPISFEELVGPQGGGDQAIQTRLIWSLQLKLHIPGNPKGFGERIFDKDSPTFNEGQIGAYRKYFTPSCYNKFYSLPQDFMRMLGYDFHDKMAIIPKRADEFRRRPVIYSEADFDDTPIGVEYHYLGHNIVRYRGGYYAIPSSMGSVDLSKSDDTVLSKLYSAQDLNSIKQKLLLS